MQKLAFLPNDLLASVAMNNTVKITTILFACSFGLLACSGGSGSDRSQADSAAANTLGVESFTATPAVELWKQNMTSYGAVHCSTMESSANSYDERLGATYYDAMWVFQQIRDFTGDGSWERCIRAARELYRDSFVLNANGQVPGYWNFSHGLTNDVIGSNSQQSEAAIAALVERAAFSGVETPLEWTVDDELSREVAYTIMTYLNARSLGLYYPEDRLKVFVDQALGHIYQWIRGEAEYVRPFMVALTAQALIEYYEAYGDAAVIPALQEALDFIWNKTWIPAQSSFQYTDRSHSTGGTEAAPDLNLLIAPAYMWLALHTGSATSFDRAEAIFAGGVSGAFLSGAKQFNQNYRWSFKYLQWKEQINGHLS